MTPKPTLQNLLIADRIYKEENGKRVIHGMFDRFVCENLPTLYADPVFIYLALTNIRKPARITLRLVSLEDLSIHWEWDLPDLIKTPMPLQVAQVEIAVTELPLPSPGVFDIVVLCEGEELGNHRFGIVLKGKDPRS